MNRLNDSTSPYLLQHADNPVDWWPWCEEALQAARHSGRPILLSIGYSACHWCHVMAHESFEDEETAQLMNRLFINIKVDREERPDLDKIYQSAHQLLSRRSGGWPLTVFLTPDDQVPFFAGTYFPRQQRYGMIAFKDLLKKVDAAWHQQQTEIREQNKSVLEAMGRLACPPLYNEAELDESLFEQALAGLQRLYDKVHGGFGTAPKFPHPTNLEFLLRYQPVQANKKLPRSMALHTLERMAAGGIHDQLGGGFFRYSVDEKWMIPHFEKMLYDNGPLLSLYANAYVASNESNYKDACMALVEWLMREMQSPEGGYYSSLDADSEGEEGKFYVWQRQDVATLLDEEEFAVVASAYGLDREPNFEGAWHLHRYYSNKEVATSTSIPLDDVGRLLESARAKLLAERQKRLRPGRDEKILTSWNALTLKGMARYAAITGDQQASQSAERSLAFIQSTMWNGSRLSATYKDGKAHLNAYLDDYAFLIDAILELLQLRWRNSDLEFAIKLADRLLEQFEADEGGFYFTSCDHEALIQRPRPYTDDAMPSGNGIAVRVLLRLGYLLGEEKYLMAAERALKSAWHSMQQLPDAHCSLLVGLQEYLQPTEIVILRGDESLLSHWYKQVMHTYGPARMVFAIPDSEKPLPPLDLKQAKEQGVIYVCKGTECGMPLTAIDQLTEGFIRW